MEAGTLNCPSCGAVVDQNSTKCKFCQAMLETMACPKCMGMMFSGTQFCPHCGARATAVVQGKNTTKKCPRCKVLLTDVQVADTQLEECTRCGGLWVDAASFEHVCSSAEARQATIGLQMPPPVPFTAVHYLPCPTCGDLMTRMNYACRSGVVISICRGHGLWLDRDQFREIIEFISAGGLDRARKIEAEQIKMDAQFTDNATPFDGMSSKYNQSMGSSFSSDERTHLLNGIASMANHFLGAKDWK